MEHRFCSTLKRMILFLLTLTLFQPAISQYYYNDIVLPGQNKDLQLYRSNKVKKVTIVSYEANGNISQDFSCQLVPAADYSIITMTSTSGFSGASTLTSWHDKDGNLVKTTDSSGVSVTTYTYRYNSEKQLAEVSNLSLGKDNKDQQEEKHIWLYENGHPQEMLHIRNGRDTLVTRFTLDEYQRVAEEVIPSKNGPSSKIYYYYNEGGQLTDIVQYNSRLQQLIPDFMFEYNEKGQLTQLISVTRGSTDYVTWKYSYLPNGLKAEEACYDKQKSLIGRVKYEYSF